MSGCTQTFEAVNGKTGELLWTYKDDSIADDEVDVMNLNNNTVAAAAAAAAPDDDDDDDKVMMVV